MRFRSCILIEWADSVKMNRIFDLNLPLELACTTKTGPDPNKPCQFPFKYKSITYNQCTIDGNEENETSAWCSTKVDDSGNHVAGQGKYGFCEPKCQPKNIGRFFVIHLDIQCTVFKALSLSNINKKFLDSKI